jgi:large subunit ribosomal protein L24
MKLKVNDKVIVIAGKDRGKTGKIIKISKKHNRVVVEKVNIRTKHVKKTATRAGEKIKFEAPINASNVMMLDPKENKPTRVGYRKSEDGKKERYSKLSGTVLDNIEPPKEKVTKEEKTEKETKAKPAKTTKRKTIKA